MMLEWVSYGMARGGSLALVALFLLASLAFGTSPANGQLESLPALTRDPATLEAGGDHTCVLTVAGSVSCWGSTVHGESDGYNGDNAVGVGVGPDHACAVLESGNVVCWGLRAFGAAEAYDGGDAVAVAAGARHTCALLEAGDIHCWGDNNRGQLEQDVVSVARAGVPFVDLDAGDWHTCGLLVTGQVYCWGFNGQGQAEDRLTPDAVALATGTHHTCVVTRVGHLNCWGSNAADQAPSMRTPEQVDVATLAEATEEALLPISAGSTWTNRVKAPTEAFLNKPWAERTFVDVTAGQFHTCVTDNFDRTTCIGARTSLAPERARFGPYVTVVAGDQHTCGLQETGIVHCWSGEGKNTDGRAATYGPAPATFISNGYGPGSIGNSCAVLATGEVVCFHSSEMPLRHDTQGDAVQAASLVWGDMCILRTTGNVDCDVERRSYTGQDAVALTSHYFGPCVLTSQANVTCQWGEQWYPWFTTGNVVKLASGAEHSCVLLSTGAVTCGYENHDGQSEDRAGTDAVDVAAGAYASCALLNTGRVECWGRADSYGDLETLPAGVALVAGYFATAVIDAGGYVWRTPLEGESGAQRLIGPDVQQFVMPHLWDVFGEDACGLLADGTIECLYETGGVRYVHGPRAFVSAA